jgi:hypothetical protein
LIHTVDLYPKAVIKGFEGTFFHDFVGTQNIAFASDKEEWKKHRKVSHTQEEQHDPVITNCFFLMTWMILASEPRLPQEHAHQTLCLPDS